jgi:glycosyltransferase involved in cell wall biosynthesis
MIAAQTLPPLEIIVADDGSTDGTDRMVGTRNDPRLRYLLRRRLRMPGILNEGLSAATGEYVMVCHDHDFYHPALLEELAAVLDRHPTALFAHCGIIGVDSKGERELAWFVRDFPELVSGREFLAAHMLPGLHSPVAALAMIRKSALKDGLLDPRFKGAADVELWLRLCTRGDVAYVAKPLIRVRERDNGSTFNSIACELAELVLKAKREYLRWVSDERRRRAVQAGWRREIDRTALLEILGPEPDMAVLQTFVALHGSWMGRLAVRVCSIAPRTVCVGVLRLLRALWRRVLILSREERERRCVDRGAVARRAKLSRATADAGSGDAV